MREFYFLNHVKSLIWVTLLALLVVWPASGAQAGSSCRDILGEGADPVGGVELTVEQARLFRVGPRGVLRLILRGDFTGEEKVALWRENVRVERLKGMFIRVPISTPGETPWSRLASSTAPQMYSK